MKLSRLFKRQPSRSAPAAAPAPMPPCTPDRATAVIGDIHGCLELFEKLWAKQDPSDVVVTVGDYIDRGEHSAQVLSRLMALNTAEPDRVICLIGNHEAMLLDFLDSPKEAGGRWLKYGGLQTVSSFGVTGAKEKMEAQERVDLRDRLRDAMGAPLERWLRGLPTQWHSGNLCVVHAGADPDLPMAEQNRDTLIWGHEAFLSKPRRDGVWIAHGHTVMPRPEQKGSRIAVDTGAYHSGCLTAARCLPDGEVYFVQSTAD